MPDPRPTSSERPASAAIAGMDGFISLAVGAALLYLNPRFLQWVSHRLFDTPFSPFLLDGREVPYREVPQFWLDLGVSAFALAMVFEGLMVLTLRRFAVALWAAVAVHLLSTLLNVAVLAIRPGGGFPLVSAVAVLVGLWSVAGLWFKLKSAGR
ncbi:MAG: hypothetical protein ACK4PI_01665 [Tepidisphaerales bacterium]